MERKELIENLIKLSDEEIREIFKETEAEKNKPIVKPKILDAKTVVKNLYELALSVDRELDCDWDDGSSPHYLFESFMESVYGKNFWKWYNKAIGY